MADAGEHRPVTETFERVRIPPSPVRLGPASVYAVGKQLTPIIAVSSNEINSAVIIIYVLVITTREPMLHVMEMHWEKVDEIKSCPRYLFDAAQSIWDAVLTHGKRNGFRNSSDACACRRSPIRASPSHSNK